MSSRDKILLDFHDTLKKWLSKRQDTLKAMEELAEEMKGVSHVANGFKIAGTAVGAVAGVGAAIFGFAAAFATAGLATPLAVAGVGAAVAGVGGAGAVGAAEVAKAVKMQQLLKDGQEKIDDEVQEYLGVVGNLSRLHKILDMQADKVVYELTEPYATLWEDIKEIATAGTKEAADAIVASDPSKLGSDPGGVLEAATTAAAEACSSVATKALLAGLEKSECIEAAKETGKEAATAAIAEADKGTGRQRLVQAAADKAVKKAIDNTIEQKGVIATAKEVVSILTSKVTKVAIKAALKIFGKKIALVAAKVTAKVAGKAAGKAAAGAVGKAAGKAVGGAVGKAIPLLNFGFVIWDIVDAAQAGKQIATGAEEEQELWGKIKELMKQANTIVADIYNPISVPGKKITKPFP